jgi:hypothetical protein
MLPIDAFRAAPLQSTPIRNCFARTELAGTFGGFGTLIPFVVAYINLLGPGSFDVLLGVGASMIAVGFFYKTPFPVQPMKAIGAVAITQAAKTATVTASIMYIALRALRSTANLS